MIRFILAIVFSLSLFAQEPLDWEMVGKIRAEAFHRSQVMDTLKHITDTIGPRLTNSPALLEANHWTKAKFEEWGLEAELDPWGPFGQGWSFSHAEVHMVSPRSFPLLALPKAWSKGTDGLVTGEAMMVKLDSPADFEKYKGKLKGKILFISDTKEIKVEEKSDFRRYSEEDLDDLCSYEIPTGGKRSFMGRYYKYYKTGLERAKFLQEEGALAMVSISSFQHGIIRVMGTNSFQPGEEEGPVELVMAIEHYNAVCRKLQAGEKVELSMDIKVEFQTDDLMGYNTIAEISAKGKGKKEIVMAGAHLDSWHAGTGALDNGVGVAVVMEAARILKALNVDMKRTVRFGLWTGEEQGLNGSREYVLDQFADMEYPDHPAVDYVPARFKRWIGSYEPAKDHEQFSVYFNMDNGGGKFRGIYAQENGGAVPIFKRWLEPFEDIGAARVSMKNTGSTDHMSFDRAGLPGFQFIQDPLSYFTRNHHSNLDVLDHVQEEDLKQASAIMATFLYHAAQRNGRFPRKPMAEKEDMSPLLDQMMPKPVESEAVSSAEKETTTAGGE